MLLSVISCMFSALVNREVDTYFVCLAFNGLQSLVLVKKRDKTRELRNTTEFKTRGNRLSAPRMERGGVAKRDR